MYRFLKILLIGCLVILSSCQVIRYHSLKLTKDFGKTKTKTIKLKTKLSDTLIRYETSNATLIFSLKDSKRLLEKELAKKLKYQIRDKDGTKALLDYFTNQSDRPMIFKNPFIGEIESEKDFILSGVYYNYLARDLLLEKNAQVILKENGSAVTKIKFEIYYDRLGNYRETFILPNDSVLLDGEIILGL